MELEWVVVMGLTWELEYQALQSVDGQHVHEAIVDREHVDPPTGGRVLG